MGADEDPVLPTVVVTLELDDQRPSCGGSGEPKSQGDRFRARHQEAHPLGARDEAADLFGKLELAAMLTREELAVRQGLGHGVHHSIRRMPKDVRAETEQVVDVVIAIHILHVRAPGRRPVRRRRPVTVVRAYSGRDHLQGSSVESLGDTLIQIHVLAHGSPPAFVPSVLSDLQAGLVDSSSNWTASLRSGSGWG